ncbi:MAG: hypothetical protein ABIQ16_18970 [Polyangiaceae bacterium]
MAKSHLLMLGLILTGSSLFAACNSDVTINGGGSGEAGDTSGAGKSSVAGGSGEAGNANGEGGEAGTADTTPTGPLNPQTVVIPSVGPTTSTQLLVAGSDYSNGKSEIVNLTIGTGKVGKGETYQDGDTIAVSSAGVGFAIERSNDKVHLLDAGEISSTFDLKDPGTDTTPVDSKAYVPVLGQSFISVLDLTEGKVSRRIDLREFDDASDSDHSVDASEGVYDSNKNIVYFLLQRIDRNSYDASFNLPCSKVNGLIIGIDAATDKIVDLNGTKAGKGIELQLVNGRSLSINADGDTAYLLADGCYDGKAKKNRGVEVVDLTDASSTVPYADETTNYLAQMILTGGSDALIRYQDENYATHWQKLDIAAGTVQAELDGVPSAVSFDGKDLLGVNVTTQIGTVVRYKLATEKSTVISDTSWVGKYDTAASTALVQ